MRIDSFSGPEYRALVEQAVRVYRDHRGEKVLVLEDGMWVKIFSRKKLLSSKMIVPAATQFYRNALRLAELAVPTVSVTAIRHLREEQKHLVWYEPLEGITLEDALTDDKLLKKYLKGFVSFLSSLHEKGVYFRSIHFGNVVFDESDSRYGLIDIADMRFSPRRLSPWLRARNFKHFSRRKMDCVVLDRYGRKRFVDDYLNVSPMSRLEKRLFLFFIAVFGLDK